MANSPAMASAMGRDSPSAGAPATTSTSRLSSVAYATEERASDEKTASALTLVRR